MPDGPERRRGSSLTLGSVSMEESEHANLSWESRQCRAALGAGEAPGLHPRDGIGKLCLVDAYSMSPTSTRSERAATIKRPTFDHVRSRRDRSSSPSSRSQAMVAMVIGGGLRRAELLALQLESIQQREEHWVIADDLSGAPINNHQRRMDDGGQRRCWRR